VANYQKCSECVFSCENSFCLLYNTRAIDEHHGCSKKVRSSKIIEEGLDHLLVSTEDGSFDTVVCG